MGLEAPRIEERVGGLGEDHVADLSE